MSATPVEITIEKQTDIKTVVVISSTESSQPLERPLPLMMEVITARYNPRYASEASLELVVQSNPYRIVLIMRHKNSIDQARLEDAICSTLGYECTASV